MIGQELPIGEHDPDEVRRAADEILSGSEFRVPPRSVFERAQDWLGEQVGRLLENVIGSGAGNLIGWAVLIVACAAAVYFLGRYGRTLTADRTIRAESTMVELTRSPSEWRTAADEAERSGDWKTGLLYRYRATVATLVADGVIADVPGRTAGEYRRDVESNHDRIAAAFAGVTDLFERAWYGDEPTGSAERDRYVELDAAVCGASAR